MFSQDSWLDTIGAKRLNLGFLSSCVFSHILKIIYDFENLLVCTQHNLYRPVTVSSPLSDRHHGTPMLLEGVRCIGAELEYDSEQSDWQGFD